MKHIPIGSAQPDQIATFAQMMGVDIAATDSPETIKAKLGKVWSGDTILVNEVEGPAAIIDTAGTHVAPEDREPGQSSPRAALIGAERHDDALGRRDPRVLLNVQKVRYGNEVSNADAVVGVNGVAFQLKTGVDLDVPYRVYEALNNAVREEITHDGEGEVITARVHAYPFNVLERPSQAEIAAWRERVDGYEATA